MGRGSAGVRLRWLGGGRRGVGGWRYRMVAAAQGASAGVGDAGWYRRPWEMEEGLAVEVWGGCGWGTGLAGGYGGIGGGGGGQAMGEVGGWGRLRWGEEAPR